MASSRIDDYDNDHDSKERVDVYESIRSFMKKLILHIPDQNFKMICYIGRHARKKKKPGNLLKKMVSKSHTWILNKQYKYHQFRIDTTGIESIKCS